VGLHAAGARFSFAISRYSALTESLRDRHRRGEVAESRIVFRSNYPGQGNGKELVLVIDQKRNHATVLGMMRPGERDVNTPCVLHLPDLGSVRITADAPVKLRCDARRWVEKPFVEIVFPAADPEQPTITYTLDVTAIHPDAPGIRGDPRYDGFRRGFLNIFQVNPRLQALANHSSSDSCPFCLYAYAEVARATPELAPGLRALDLIRMTLDRYLGGMKGYGIPGYNPSETGADTVETEFVHMSGDVLPSLLIAAGIYARNAPDREWARVNYTGLRDWTAQMLSRDLDGDGLIEFPASGNSAYRSRDDDGGFSNWWDCVGFGHADAYVNALAYRALREMTAIAGMAGEHADAALFADAGDRLRAAYFPAFFNPETGLLGGWRSRDGVLHDYAFTFVNGIAVVYGLVGEAAGNALMDALLRTMREVGYTNFRLGLPGNLRPIAKLDYLHVPEKHRPTDPAEVLPHELRWGGGVRDDGTDGFQHYENGGATACYAYFTIRALDLLGRRNEADATLMPMLEAFREGEFQGKGLNGMSKDWKSWSGECWGYEGFLVDGFLTLLAVAERAPFAAASPGIGLT
jgi:hypothetical protein